VIQNARGMLAQTCAATTSAQSIQLKTNATSTEVVCVIGLHHPIQMCALKNFACTEPTLVLAMLMLDALSTQPTTAQFDHACTTLKELAWTTRHTIAFGIQSTTTHLDAVETIAPTALMLQTARAPLVAFGELELLEMNVAVSRLQLARQHQFAALTMECALQMTLATNIHALTKTKLIATTIQFALGKQVVGATSTAHARTTLLN